MVVSRLTPFGRLRTPPLALRNVVRGGRRSLAAVAGVAFSVMMVLLQLGFLQAVRITATDLYDQLDFDVALIAANYDQFYDPGFFPRDRLRQAGAVPDVTAAYPFYATFGLWRCPPYPPDRPPDAPDPPTPGPVVRWLAGSRLPRPLIRRELLVIGIDLDHHPFRPPIRGAIAAAHDLLAAGDRVLLNADSHVDFGWSLRARFDGWELNRHAVRLAGGFRLLRGFASDGAALCGDDAFVRLCEYPSREALNFGFLKVRPGVRPETVAERLRAVLPPDVVPQTRDALFERERAHWIDQTSTGKLFSFGVLVAMIVASAVVYQVLSSDIRNHLPEYATLKAMGYGGGALAGIIVAQSLMYMMTAYVVAVIVGDLAYRATQALAGIPMEMTAQSLAIALGLSLAVGLITGGLSLRRLRAADPAELF
jgi:putative ABC transport system permease protein